MPVEPVSAHRKNSPRPYVVPTPIAFPLVWRGYGSSRHPHFRHCVNRSQAGDPIFVRSLRAMTGFKPGWRPPRAERSQWQSATLFERVGRVVLCRAGHWLAWLAEWGAPTGGQKGSFQSPSRTGW
jgi:hypothetical protein